jgi:putative tricarboxylic transport membrane protein
MMKRLLAVMLAGLTAAVFLASTAGGVSAAEEKYPSKQINWYIHASAGGGTDIFSRMVAIPLRSILKTDIIISTMSGGSGARAMNYIITQPADGYVLYSFVQTSLATIARRMTNAKMTDFVGIARGCYDPQALVVPAKGRFQNIKEAVEFAKANPKKLKFAGSMIGSTDHVGLFAFSNVAGFDPEYVPFKSGGEVNLALLSGTVDIAPSNPSEFMGQYEAGTIKPILFFTEKRLKEFPDVPTAKELGWDLELATWRGVVIRSGTPQPIVDTLRKAFIKAMQDKVYQDYLKNNAMGPESIMEGEKFHAYILKEYPIWEKAMNELGLVKK